MSVRVCVCVSWCWRASQCWTRDARCGRRLGGEGEGARVRVRMRVYGQQNDCRSRGAGDWVRWGGWSGRVGGLGEWLGWVQPAES